MTTMTLHDSADPDLRSNEPIPQAARMSAADGGAHRIGIDANQGQPGMRNLVESHSPYGQAVADTVSALSGEALKGFKDSMEAHRKAGLEAIASTARAAREAVAEFESRSPHVARVVLSAADTIERVANDVQDQAPGDLVRSLSKLARRQPMLLAGCGIVAGFVAFRLLRDGGDEPA